jgi:hypothetical protein
MGLGLGFAELVLVMLIVLAVFRSTRLPGAGDLLGRLLRGQDPARPRPGRWSLVDWLLLATTLALAAALAASFVRDAR